MASTTKRVLDRVLGLPLAMFAIAFLILLLVVNKLHFPDYGTRHRPGGIVLEGARLIDVPPTILHAMELPVPSDKVNPSHDVACMLPTLGRAHLLPAASSLTECC